MSPSTITETLKIILVSSLSSLLMTSLNYHLKRQCFLNKDTNAVIFSLGPPTNRASVTRVFAILKEKEACRILFIVQPRNLVSFSKILIRNHPVVPLMLVWLVLEGEMRYMYYVYRYYVRLIS